MKKLPLLKTSRLWLSELQAGDSSAVFRLMSNPGVLQFTDSEPHKTLKDSKKWINTISRGFQKGHTCFWGLRLQSNKQLIGIAGFYDINTKHAFASLKVLLAPAATGQNYMQEALPEIMRYAFSSLHLNRLEAQVYTENIPAVRFFTKMKFTKEGILHQNFLINQCFCDSYMFAMLKTKFLRLYAK